MAGTKPGRRSKGGTRHSVRFPEDHLARYQREADKLGIPVSDHVANLAALAAGLPAAWPAPTPAETLPLEFAA